MRGAPAGSRRAAGCRWRLDVVTYRYVEQRRSRLERHLVRAADARLTTAPSSAAERLASPSTARVLLPLDTAAQSGVETGLELGGSARRLLAAPRFVLDGGLALAAPVDIVGGQSARAPGARRRGRGSGSPPARAWAVGVGARPAPASPPNAAFITAVPRAAARFALGQRVWMAVLVEVPVAGRDRTDLVASLFAGYAPAEPLRGWPTSPMLASNVRDRYTSAPRPMPKIKMKSNSSAKKRFKLTANGRVKRKKAYLRHNLDVEDDLARSGSLRRGGLHQQDAGASDQSDAPLRLTRRYDRHASR